MLLDLYWRWYRQRKSDDWFKFETWMIINYIPNKLLPIKDLEVIKKVLVSIRGNLKKQAEKWWDNWRITVPVYYILMFKTHRNEWFKLWKGDEAWVNLKSPAHYILSWIVCVDDFCKIYAALKANNIRYPKRTDWGPGEWRYKNAKFMHGWHSISKQSNGDLTIKPRRFLTKECIKGRQWWECPKN